jgi:hypothetical protein
LFIQHIHEYHVHSTKQACAPIFSRKSSEGGALLLSSVHSPAACRHACRILKYAAIFLVLVHSLGSSFGGQHVGNFCKICMQTRHENTLQYADTWQHNAGCEPPQRPCQPRATHPFATSLPTLKKKNGSLLLGGNVSKGTPHKFRRLAKEEKVMPPQPPTIKIEVIKGNGIGPHGNGPMGE